jgi:hypothetical protein
MHLTVENVELNEELHTSTSLPLYITVSISDILADCMQLDLALGGLHENHPRIAAHAHHSTTCSRTQRCVT